MAVTVETAHNQASDGSAFPGLVEVNVDYDKPWVRQDLIKELIKLKQHDSAENLIHFADKIVKYISKGKE